MGSGGDNPVPARSKTGWRGLFTHEDPFNAHKLLGLFCILHFLYRFAYIGPSDMAFRADGQTLFCLAVHALLSASSLVFRIPKKRIVDGDRIWPEYRWHSIIFAYRSIACLGLTFFETRYGLQPNYLANAAIVLATRAFADLASWSVADHHSSSVQDLAAPPFVRFFFSFMQFQATATCLVGVRRFSTQFFYVWLIQCTAFLMTLRRKNVVPPKYPFVIYAVMLVMAYLVHMHEYTTVGCWLLVNVIGHTAAYLRLGLRISKYAIWTGFAAALHFGRDALVHGSVDYTVQLAGAFATSACAIFAVGARKVNGGQHNAASRALDGLALASLAVTVAAAAAGQGATAPLPPPPPPTKVFGLF